MSTSKNDEKTPMYQGSAPVLYPDRLSSGAALWEKLLFGSVVALSFATVIVCIVFGLKTH